MDTFLLSCLLYYCRMVHLEVPVTCHPSEASSIFCSYLANTNKFWFPIWDPCDHYEHWGRVSQIQNICDFVCFMDNTEQWYPLVYYCIWSQHFRLTYCHRVNCALPPSSLICMQPTRPLPLHGYHLGTCHRPLTWCTQPVTRPLVHLSKDYFNKGSHASAN